MGDNLANIPAPDALDLTPHIQLPDDLKAFTLGGFADVYKTGCEGRGWVAVKVIRDMHVHNPKSKDSLSSRISREIKVWSSLKHKNILPFFGFCSFSTYGYQSLSLVSPWMSSGTATQYLRDHPDVDRIDFMYGVARGLKYLHRKEIVHGDLKGANILVSDTGTPCLCDFGLATFLQDNPNLSVGSGGTTSTGNIKGSARWMSPELVDGKKSTKNSDMWAFGCTVLELMTLCHPYAVFNWDIQVIGAIVRNRLPWEPAPENGQPDPAPHPVAFQHDLTLWDLCLRCWSSDPYTRPTAAYAARSLERLLDAANLSEFLRVRYGVPPNSTLHLLFTSNRSNTSRRFWNSVDSEDSPSGVVVQSSWIRGPVFNVTLEKSLAAARIAGLPAVVFRCIQYLEVKEAEQEEGIYLLSGRSAAINSLRDRFNTDGDFNLLESKESWDPCDIATLHREYLGGIHDNLLTNKLYIQFMNVIKLYEDRKTRVHEIAGLISKLPLANYTLLRALMAHLNRIAQNSAVNHMTVHRIATKFDPFLAIPEDIICLMLESFTEVFDVNNEDGSSEEDVESD